MKRKLYASGIVLALFLLLIVLVRTVDVAPIGPEGTRIGLSHLNAAVRDLVGVHLFWYRFTEALGVASILLGLLFALAGLRQLLRRKSLRRVDRDILALGALYAALAVLYVLFEAVVVNYRPVIMPGDLHPEASFPSSHTMLICVIVGSAMLVIRQYAPAGRRRTALLTAGAVLLAAAVAGRLASGVHWCTDILGGVLISAALLLAFSAVLERLAGADRRAPRENGET